MTSKGRDLRADRNKLVTHRTEFAAHFAEFLHPFVTLGCKFVGAVAERCVFQAQRRDFAGMVGTLGGEHFLKVLDGIEPGVGFGVADVVSTQPADESHGPSANSRSRCAYPAQTSYVIWQLIHHTRLEVISW